MQMLRQRTRSLSYLLLTLAVFGTLGGCASLTPQSDAVKHDTLRPRSFTFKDGGQALYYSFTVGAPSAESALIFFVSGSGCASVKRRFPGYFDPIRHQLDARVLVLQKRGIEENSHGNICPRAFTLTDYFDQTVADQTEFINTQLAMQAALPKTIVLMGASEGAIVAAKIASVDARMTHLALIGSGGSTVRENLQLLSQKLRYLRTPEKKFAAIAADPGSTTQSAWGHSYKYWSSLLDVDIGNLLLSLDIPIAMAMGEQDKNVPIETAYALKQKFVERKKQNFHLYAFPDADHHLYDRARTLSHVKEFLEGLVAQIHQEKAR
ncbi:MAG TPA: prolyl oligopeptidase family serine peptidase [Herbaspirillum sp.]|nr:prolyl oligopeptidase family serine peptidase [Herbaspirillum sp.]